MNIGLYTLTSSLHDRNAVDALSLGFLSSIEAVLGFRFDFRGDDFSTYGQSELDVIFIRTGGSEGLFKQVFPTLSGNILLLRMKNPGVLTDYFLKNPIRNHHIVFSGKQKELFEEFMKQEN